MSAICQQCHRLDKYCACNVSLSPLTEQARAAEQEQVTCPSCLDGSHGRFSQPTQPPAGDVDPNAEVVTRMMNANFAASGTPYSYPPKMCKGMAAALAVAQQERDAQWEKAIRHDMPSEFTDLGIDTFVATLRNRLAKPAEQTDKQKVEAILVNHDFNCTCPNKAIAAEIVAALKAGKHE